MKQLSEQQRELVMSLVKRLQTIHGIRAVVLGGPMLGDVLSLGRT